MLCNACVRYCHEIKIQKSINMNVSKMCFNFPFVKKKILEILFFSMCPVSQKVSCTSQFVERRSKDTSWPKTLKLYGLHIKHHSAIVISFFFFQCFFIFWTTILPSHKLVYLIFNLLYHFKWEKCNYSPSRFITFLHLF